MQIENNPGDLPSQNDNNHIGQVSFPFTQTQFTDFLVSLLGRPQTITKKFVGSFEITKDTLITLFEVLNQRIYQQNESKLIQFRATIYYSDNSTVTLNGFDHLVHYNEKLPLISQAVHLTWTYVVKFRDKESFEKQEISISFITETENEISFDEDTKFDSYHSFINFRIAHTARTWGADIEGLLTRHLQTIVKKTPRLLEFFKYNSNKVEYTFSGTLMLITFTFSIFKTLKLIKIVDTSNVSVWLHHYAKIGFLFVGTYILIKATLLLLDEFEIYETPSFVLLTQESEKAKIKTAITFKKRARRYVGVMIGSIILGVLGNYVYDWLTK